MIDDLTDRGLEDLDLESALIRAFAMGLSDRQGATAGDDLEQLHEVASSRYETHLINTAYREGQRFGDRGPNAPLESDALPEFLRGLDMDLASLPGSHQSTPEHEAIPVMLTQTPMHGVQVPSPLTLQLPGMLFRHNRRP